MKSILEEQPRAFRNESGEILNPLLEEESKPVGMSLAELQRQRDKLQELIAAQQNELQIKRELMAEAFKQNSQPAFQQDALNEPTESNPYEDFAAFTTLAQTISPELEQLASELNAKLIEQLSGMGLTADSFLEEAKFSKEMMAYAEADVKLSQKFQQKKAEWMSSQPKVSFNQEDVHDLDCPCEFCTTSWKPAPKAPETKTLPPPLFTPKDWIKKYLSAQKKTKKADAKQQAEFLHQLASDQQHMTGQNPFTGEHNDSIYDDFDLTRG